MPAKFLVQLLQPSSYTLVTHTRPDGDALGSQLALGLFLKALGKDVLMIADEHPPSNLAWMAREEDLVIYDESSIEHRLKIDQTEAVVVVDTNALKRLGKLEDPIARHQGSKFLIDHHPDPEHWFLHTFVRTRSASTGELIHRLISTHNPEFINHRIAEALYTAIVTDTGSFRFNNVTPQTHRITAELLERGGFNPEGVYTKVYNTRSMGSLHLLGLALNTLTLDYGGKVGYLYVTQEMFQQTGTTTEDIRDFVDYLLAVEGVEAGVMFTELKLNIKMSFRSQGDVAVNKWAQQFRGGGHRNAAGAFIRGGLKKTIRKVMNAAADYLPFQRP